MGRLAGKHSLTEQERTEEAKRRKATTEWMNREILGQLLQFFIELVAI